MPIMDGWEVSRRMRADPPLWGPRSIPARSAAVAQVSVTEPAGRFGGGRGAAARSAWQAFARRQLGVGRRRANFAWRRAPKARDLLATLKARVGLTSMSGAFAD